jgi:hypothetical protein
MTPFGHPGISNRVISRLRDSTLDRAETSFGPRRAARRILLLVTL